MSEHNTKALYFCHTHPNLFLQKPCESCRRGMCHTCIHHNNDYCQSCLKQLHRTSDTYEDKNELIKVLGFASIMAVIVPFYYHFTGLNLNAPDLIESLLLVFYISASAAGTHYLLKHTDFIDEIRKIPFIGFKLSLILLAIIVVFGISVFYMLYKLIKILRHHFSKTSKMPLR